MGNINSPPPTAPTSWDSSSVAFPPRTFGATFTAPIDMPQPPRHYSTDPFPLSTPPPRLGMEASGVAASTMHMNSTTTAPSAYMYGPTYEYPQQQPPNQHLQTMVQNQYMHDRQQQVTPNLPDIPDMRFPTPICGAQTTTILPASPRPVLRLQSLVTHARLLLHFYLLTTTTCLNGLGPLLLRHRSRCPCPTIPTCLRTWRRPWSYPTLRLRRRGMLQPHSRNRNTYIKGPRSISSSTFIRHSKLRTLNSIMTSTPELSTSSCRQNRLKAPARQGSRP